MKILSSPAAVCMDDPRSTEDVFHNQSRNYRMCARAHCNCQRISMTITYVRISVTHIFLHYFLSSFFICSFHTFFITLCASLFVYLVDFVHCWQRTIEQMLIEWMRKIQREENWLQCRKMPRWTFQLMLFTFRYAFDFSPIRYCSHIFTINWNRWHFKWDFLFLFFFLSCCSFCILFFFSVAFREIDLWMVWLKKLDPLFQIPLYSYLECNS